MPYITKLIDSCMPQSASTMKRKRDQVGDEAPMYHPLFPPTQLDSLVLDGMGNEQVWQQLELRTSKLARVLGSVMTSTGADEEEESDESSDDATMDAQSDEDAWVDEENEDDDEEAEESADEGFAGASDFSDVDPNEVFYEPLQSEEEQHQRKAEKEREEMMQMYNISDPALLDALLGQQGAEDEDDEEEEDKPVTPLRGRHPTLDDDFFSIDEFNRMTEAEERRSQTQRANLSGEEDDINFDDDIDLFAPIDDDDDDSEEEDEGMSAADIRYEDFFDPVPHKSTASTSRPSQAPAAASPPTRKTLVRFHEQVRVRPIKRAKSRPSAGLIGNGEDDLDEEDSFDEPENEEVDEEEDDEEKDDEDDEEKDEGEEEEEEDDMEEVDLDDNAEEEEESLNNMEEDDEALADATASRVAQDLFADEAEDVDTPQSTHERHLAQLAEEIARYEEENVQQRDWTLMGEASTRERPTNSLLEEDLEFERTAKAAPIQTQEHAEGIEAMIKRRILDKQYDDVIRQRDLDALPFTASSMLELSDAKSAKSLAELYEDEYQAARGTEQGQAPQSEADEKLANDHASIAADLESLFAKLDALSNAHYTPKAPKAAIQTLSNTASIAMESALPTTMSTGTMLAPEEVYEAPKHAAALTGDKSEMSHTEKQRLHHQLRHEKRKRNERIQRVEAAIERQRGPRKSDTKAEKDKALKGLLGNKGVTVVGKDSQRAKRDAAKPAPSSSRLKL